MTIPLPSEIIMPFSGYLVFTGQFRWWASPWPARSDNVLGSWLAYYVGVGRRPFVERYGRHFLVLLDMNRRRWCGETWRGGGAIGRLLPGANVSSAPRRHLRAWTSKVSSSIHLAGALAPLW